MKLPIQLAFYWKLIDTFLFNILPWLISFAYSPNTNRPSKKRYFTKPENLKLWNNKPFGINQIRDFKNSVNYQGHMPFFHVFFIRWWTAYLALEFKENSPSTSKWRLVSFYLWAKANSICHQLNSNKQLNHLFGSQEFLTILNEKERIIV